MLQAERQSKVAAPAMPPLHFGIHTGNKPEIVITLHSVQNCDVNPGDLLAMSACYAQTSHTHTHTHTHIFGETIVITHVWITD